MYTKLNSTSKYCNQPKEKFQQRNIYFYCLFVKVVSSVTLPITLTKATAENWPTLQGLQVTRVKRVSNQLSW